MTKRKIFLRDKKTDDFWSDMHKKVSKEPIVWASKACELKFSADY